METWDIKSYDERGKQIEFAQTHWAEQIEATNFATFTYHGCYDMGVYIDYDTNTIKIMDIA